jgi:plasmid stability protein
MPAVTIRNLSDETHRALKARAAQHKRSTESEIRAILDAAVFPPDRLLLGTALNEIGRKAGFTQEDIDAIESLRSRTPAEPMTFE